MGFASASILISINGDTPVAQWRQDCVAGSVVTVALSDNVGATTYRWRLIGRPEGSTTAGAGPEPLVLGGATGAAFTIDIKGTYVVECLVNGGAPDADIIVGGVAYLESFLSPGNLPLRLLGPGETSEDIADPQVAQGWIKMLNRWLRKVAAGGGTGDSYKVMNDENDPSPDYLFYKVKSLDGSVTITDDTTNLRTNFAVTNRPTPVLTKRYYLTGVPSDLEDISPRPFLFSLIQPDPADLQPIGGSTYGIIMDSPLGDPSLVTWPSGILLAHIVARVVNAHGGITYPMSFGTGDSQGAILTRVPSQFVYQVAPWPAKPLLTADYQTLIVPLSVQQLTGSTGDRLRAWFKCNAQGGPVTDEVFEIHLGDSYLDTLFPPSSGGTGVDTYKVMTDSPDTDPDYLDAKLVDENGDAFPVAVVDGVRKVVVSSGDTFKVMTDSPDTAPGYLDDKIVDNANNPLPVVTVGGVRKVQLPSGVALSTDLPLPDGIADPGDVASGEATAKGHVHPLVPPDTHGGKLYTAYVPDVLQLAAVDAVYAGGLASRFLEVWTGFWRSNGPGAMPSSLTDGVPPWAGMRLLDATDGAYAGPYDLLDTGASVTTTNQPYYVQADGSLGTSPPAASGELTAVVSGGYASIFSETGSLNLTSWPGGTIPVTVVAWVTGGSGSYMFGMKSDSVRSSMGLGRAAPGSEDGTPYAAGYLPDLQAIGNTPQQFTFYVNVGAISSTDLTDCLLMELQLRGADGATLHIGYGGSQPSEVLSLFTSTAQHFAILQRSTDANTSADFLNGMYVKVTGGSTHGGQTYQATIPTPFVLDSDSQTWASVSPPTPAPSFQLLTAGQLSLAGPNTNQATAFVKEVLNEVPLQTFTEHDTALGGQTILAGSAIRFHVRVSLWADDPDATTFIRCYLRAHAPGGAEAWVYVADTQRLHNTSPGDFVAVGSMTSDYPIPIGSVLQADYHAVSDSADGVNINFVYNNPAHSTYIELPLTIGFAGTDDHQQLVDRGAFLVAGDATKYGHPQSFIEPGRVHSPTGATIYLVDGVLTMPQSNTARVGSVEGDVFIGISTDATGSDPWQKGDEIALWFDSGCDIHGSASVPDGVGMLQLGSQFVDPSNPSAGQRCSVAAFSCLHFIYDGGVNWYLSSPPVFQ